MYSLYSYFTVVDVNSNAGLPLPLKPEKLSFAHSAVSGRCDTDIYGLDCEIYDFLIINEISNSRSNFISKTYMTAHLWRILYK